MSLKLIKIIRIYFKAKWIIYSFFARSQLTSLNESNDKRLFPLVYTTVEEDYGLIYRGSAPKRSVQSAPLRFDHLF